MILFNLTPSLKEGKTDPEICGPGLFTLQSNSKKCKNCPRGHYCDQGMKTPCPAGTKNDQKNKIYIEDCTDCESFESKYN
jgi:hypothetical protein